MAEGSRIRENPTLIPVYCDRFIAISWDGGTVRLTLGSASKLPERMGDNKMPAAVVDPTLASAMPREVAAELHAKLGQLLRLIDEDQRPKAAS